MGKYITDEQITAKAKEYGIEKAALQAVMEVECKGRGFNSDLTPVILFERHKFYEGLIAINWVSKAKEWYKLYPNICNPKWGGYGKESEQHGRLQQASALNRDVALESTSWGLGQVLGSNWKALGYKSLQAFINAMYKDEVSQLDAMCRFIKVNGLISHINNKEWAKFAKAYNGPKYAENKYDTKLAAAYKKFKGD